MATPSLRSANVVAVPLSFTTHKSTTKITSQQQSKTFVSPKLEVSATDSFPSFSSDCGQSERSFVTAQSNVSFRTAPEYLSASNIASLHQQISDTVSHEQADSDIASVTLETSQLSSQSSIAIAKYLEWLPSGSASLLSQNSQVLVDDGEPKPTSDLSQIPINAGCFNIQSPTPYTIGIPTKDGKSELAPNAASLASDNSQAPTGDGGSVPGNTAPPGPQRENGKMVVSIQIPELTPLVDVIPDWMEWPAEESANIFINWAGLTIGHHIPGIPSLYEKEWEEGRALYVMIPQRPTWTIPFVESIFRNLAPVDKSVTVIDLQSGDTFRWVIMSTAYGARIAADLFNTEIVDGARMGVMMAFNPDYWYNVGNCFCWDAWFYKKKAASLARIAAQRAICLGYPRREIPKDYGPIGPPAKKPSKDTVKAESPGKSSAQQQQAGLQQKNVFARSTVPAIVPLAPLIASAINPAAPPVNGPVRAAVVLGVPASVPTAQVATRAPSASHSFSSWASIASTAAAPNQVINLHTGNKTNRAVPKPQLNFPSTSTDAESLDNLRVVIIFNLPSTVTLEDVSNAVKEGPLASITFGHDVNTAKRYVGIIFQKAYDADVFYRALVEEREKSKPARFKFIVDVDKTSHPADEVIQAMAGPIYATRRLTIVKSGFFFSNNERNIRGVIEKVVERHRIQLIHLYNGGNATIVFADVKSAIAVKNTLDYMSTHAGTKSVAPSYSGLQTSFSKDPCTLPGRLRLLTDMN